MFEKQRGWSVIQTRVGTPHIRFNPAPDTKPAYLEREASMLQVNVFIEQAVYYINSEFRNKPPEKAAIQCWPKKNVVLNFANISTKEDQIRTE